MTGAARDAPTTPAFSVLDIKGGLDEQTTRVEIMALPTHADILHAVFWQALTGRQTPLPPGTTTGLLREALAMDKTEATRIFYHVKELAAEAARAAAPRQPLTSPPPPPPPPPSRSRARPIRPQARNLARIRRQPLKPAPEPAPERIIERAAEPAGRVPAEPAAGIPDENSGKPAPPIPHVTSRALVIVPPLQAPSKPAPRQTWKKPLAAIAVAITGIAALVLATLLRPAAPLVPPPPPQDHASYQLLLARAKSGDRASQYTLATLLDRRFTQAETVTPKNDALAFEWYTQSAQAGFAPAETALGYAFLNGHGTAPDPALAARWYTAAAQAGDAQAENTLGYLYFTGAGEPLDITKALAWFRRAAAQNDAQAEDNLANAYRYGQGVPRDLTTAAQYYARAAAQGERNAENSLGYLAYTGTGIPQNDAQAAALFAKAAAAGLPEAEVNLGMAYATGAGLPKNPQLGAAWVYAGLAHGAHSAPAALAIITPLLTPQQLAAARAAASGLK